MGRACLALYTATADRAWLDRASAAANGVGAHFVGRDGGFATAMTKVGDPLPPKPQIGENISVARFSNLLFAYTGDPRHRKLAEAAMKYAASPQMAEPRLGRRRPAARRCRACLRAAPPLHRRPQVRRGRQSALRNSPARPTFVQAPRLGRFKRIAAAEFDRRIPHAPRGRRVPLHERRVLGPRTRLAALTKLLAKR